LGARYNATKWKRDPQTHSVGNRLGSQ
jgi:hypothetical protein